MADKKLIESQMHPLTYGSTIGLEEQPLTDGSRVYNVVLFNADGTHGNLIRFECDDKAHAEKTYATMLAL